MHNLGFFGTLVPMARHDPTLISFRLPRDVVQEIESRPDCPPPAGHNRIGGASLWVRELVLRQLGLESGADTQKARERTVREFLDAVTAYWRVHRVVTELQAQPNKKGKAWTSKITRAEKQLVLVEDRLEAFARADGHPLGCDCDECQEAAGLGPA